MLKWAFIFLVVGLVLGVLGFGGIGGAFIGIAKILFFVALADVPDPARARLARRQGGQGPDRPIVTIERGGQ